MSRDDVKQLPGMMRFKGGKRVGFDPAPMRGVYANISRRHPDSGVSPDVHATQKAIRISRLGFGPALGANSSERRAKQGAY